MQRRTITSEVKQEIIAKIKDGGKVGDLAGQYGISSKTIYNWLRSDTGEIGHLTCGIQQTQARE